MDRFLMIAAKSCAKKNSLWMQFIPTQAARAPLRKRPHDAAAKAVRTVALDCQQVRSASLRDPL